MSRLPRGARRGLAVLVLLLAGAAGFVLVRAQGGPAGPVILTLWHNPTGHGQDALSAAVERFNRSLGRERGIAVLVASVARAEIIHEKLLSIAAEEPGAPEAPDMVVAYPKSVLPLIGRGRMVPLDERFTRSELAAYVPSFIEAGRIQGRKLWSFPIGRGTECLILNRTLWDRFAEATGASLSELGTLEGLARAAAKYHQWTNGRMFFMVDNPFNLLQAAMAQMGEEPFVEGRLNTASPVYERVWRLLFEPAAKGRAAIYRGYGTDLARAGMILCWTSATAGVSFLPDRVVYPDNTSEPVEFQILPFPVLEGCKEKVAILRSGGLSLFRSDRRREAAAATFLKWLTAPEENLRYIQGTGYLPVTNRAMETARRTWGEGASGVWASCVETMALMEREYRLLPQSPLPDYGEMELRYEGRLRELAAEVRDRYRKETAEERTEEEAWRRASEGAYERFLR